MWLISVCHTALPLYALFAFVLTFYIMHCRVLTLLSTRIKAETDSIALVNFYFSRVNNPSGMGRRTTLVLY